MSDLINFDGYEIRKQLHNGEDYFSIIDIVAVLSESPNPRRYWSDLKAKLKKEGSQVYEDSVQLKMPAPDGKNYKTDCGNRETVFRIIQSIPSPKAEPFKRWLAETAEQRLQEMEDPTKGMDRLRRIIVVSCT